MKLPRMRRFWAWPSELRREGILGLNARNVLFLGEFNKRRFYPEVDDKIVTKTLCVACEIPVPETYSVIERCGDTRKIGEFLPDGKDFVIKPARGAAGRGVVIITGRVEEGFLNSRGEAIPAAEVRHHILTVLSGLYSLGGQADRVLIEERVRRHPVFEDLAVGGTPDIRLVIHCGVPLMAMLRLPTRESGGRANLHQGGVGVAVDMQRGTTFGGVWRGNRVTVHPDTGEPVEGIEVPDWRRILEIGRTAGSAFRLRYIGVDIVLSENKGPLVLEANARPGLGIQIANRRGMLSVLEGALSRSETLAAHRGGGPPYRRAHHGGCPVENVETL